MLRLLSSLIGLLLVLGLALSALVLSTRDSAPELPASAAADMRSRQARAQAQFVDRLQAGGDAVIELGSADLDLLLASLLAEQMSEARARVTVGDDRAQITLSTPLPEALGGWLNLEADLVQSGQGLAIGRLELGSLSLPPTLATPVVQQILSLLGVPDLLSSIALKPGAVELRPAAEDQLANGPPLVAFADAERVRVLEAQRRLYELIERRGSRRPVDAAELLAELIASPSLENGDPAAENRAAILALAVYVNGRSIPDPASHARKPKVTLHLHGRDDWAQHFFTSAALQVKGGSGLANLIGFAKELHDSGGSSGFSFKDLAANRAGNRFAELAVGDPGTARRIRAMARGGFSDEDLVPAPDWLPERMSRATFRRDFGGRDGRMYQVVVNEIERRIGQLPMVRALEAAAGNTVPTHAVR